MLAASIILSHPLRPFSRPLSIESFSSVPVLFAMLSSFSDHPVVSPGTPSAFACRNYPRNRSSSSIVVHSHILYRFSNTSLFLPKRLDRPQRKKRATQISCRALMRLGLLCFATLDPPRLMFRYARLAIRARTARGSRFSLPVRLDRLGTPSGKVDAHAPSTQGPLDLVRAFIVRVLIIPSAPIESGVSAANCSVCSRPAGDRSSWEKEKAGMEGRGGKVTGRSCFSKACSLSRRCSGTESN